MGCFNCCVNAISAAPAGMQYDQAHICTSFCREQECLKSCPGGQNIKSTQQSLQIILWCLIEAIGLFFFFFWSHGGTGDLKSSVHMSLFLSLRRQLLEDGG